MSERLKNNPVIRAILSLFAFIGRLTGTKMPALPQKRGALIALGGFSGSGKSTLARAIAGASDVTVVEIDYLWKAELGVAPHEKPPQGSYTPERRARVLAEYERLCEEALRRGRTVIAQKIFAKAEERDLIEALTRHCGADFHGFWLEAPVEVLKKRVRERVNDVSDTTEAVVDKQASLGTGELGWTRVDVNRDRVDICSDVMRVLQSKGIMLPPAAVSA